MKISIFRNLLVLSFVNVLRICQSIMEGSIVGGDHAKIKKFPHAAFIAVSCQQMVGMVYYSCGSSIVNHRILMTAAHCLDNCLPSSLVAVSVGSKHKNRNTANFGKSFLMHSDFEAGVMVNDIALIFLEKSLKMSKNVKRVALRKNPPHYGDTAMLAGWGYIDEDNRIGTTTLKFAKQTVMKNEHCVQIMWSLNEGTFCATGTSERDEIDFGYGAVGDSGSGLIVNGYIAIGVVSYKKPGLAPEVVVYTDTAYFYKWIKQNSRRLYCQK